MRKICPEYDVAGKCRYREKLYKRVTGEAEKNNLQEQKRWRKCIGRTIKNSMGNFWIYILLDKAERPTSYYKIVKKLRSDDEPEFYKRDREKVDEI